MGKIFIQTDDGLAERGKYPGGFTSDFVEFHSGFCFLYGAPCLLSAMLQDPI
jgi:hypothetical protein